MASNELSNFYFDDEAVESEQDSDFKIDPEVEEEDVDIDIEDEDIGKEDDGDKAEENLDGFIVTNPDEIEEGYVSDADDVIECKELMPEELEMIYESQKRSLDDTTNEFSKKKFRKIRKKIGEDEDENEQDHLANENTSSHQPSIQDKAHTTVDDFVVDDIGDFNDVDVDEYRYTDTLSQQHSLESIQLATRIFGDISEYLKAGNENLATQKDDRVETVTSTKPIPTSTTKALKSIVSIDIPERLQQRLSSYNIIDGRVDISDAELFIESAQIKRQYYDKLPNVTEQIIFRLLDLMLRQCYEVPFIAQYQKGLQQQAFKQENSSENLQQIYEADLTYQHQNNKRLKLINTVNCTNFINEECKTTLLEFLTSPLIHSDIDLHDANYYLKMMEFNTDASEPSASDTSSFKRPERRRNFNKQRVELKQICQPLIEILNAPFLVKKLRRIVNNENEFEEEEEEFQLNEFESLKSTAQRVLDSNENFKSFEELYNVLIDLTLNDIASNPFVRLYFREELLKKACLSTQRTFKGKSEIDWTHKFLNVSFLKNKPISCFYEELDLNTNSTNAMAEQFALLDDAFNTKFIEYTFEHLDDVEYEGRNEENEGEDDNRNRNDESRGEHINEEGEGRSLDTQNLKQKKETNAIKEDSNEKNYLVVKPESEKEKELITSEEVKRSLSIVEKLCGLQSLPTATSTISGSDEAEGESNLHRLNNIRKRIIDRLCNKLLLPYTYKYFYTDLLNKSMNYIARQCNLNLKHRLSVESYNIPESNTQSYIFALSIGDHMSSPHGVVLDADGMLVDSQTMPTIKKAVAPQYLRDRNPQLQFDSRHTLFQKSAEIQRLRQRISKYDPILFIVGLDDDILTCENFVNDLEKACRLSKSSHSLKPTLILSDIAKIYSSSFRAKQEFSSFFKENENKFDKNSNSNSICRLACAVSLGRSVLDPLSEICSLYLSDKRSENLGLRRDILSLRMHSSQYLCEDSILLKHLRQALIDKTCERGVDLNRMLGGRVWRTSPLRFVAGLGPAYARYLLVDCKWDCVESRAQLLRSYEGNVKKNVGLGEVVFLNCSGFIFVEKKTCKDCQNRCRSNSINSEGQVDESEWVEPSELLDSTRIHPENYELARELVMFALDLQNKLDLKQIEKLVVNGGPQMNNYISELRRSHLPKLNKIDLQTFANEIAKQQQSGAGNDQLMSDLAKPELFVSLLRDIVLELGQSKARALLTPSIDGRMSQADGTTIDGSGNHLLVDSEYLNSQCRPFSGATKEEQFWYLTNETPRTLCSGSIHNVTVLRSTASFLLVRLDSVGIVGTIHLDKVYDRNFVSVSANTRRLCQINCPEPPTDPEEISNQFLNYFPKNTRIQARLLDIQFAQNRRYQISLDARPNHLHSKRPYENLAPRIYEPKQLDIFLDFNQTDDENDAGTASSNTSSNRHKNKPKKLATRFRHRKIDFPLFKNISTEVCEQEMLSNRTGDILIRPSSRGLKYLIASQKISQDPYIIVHFEIKEFKKPNPFGLGEILEICGQKFEDLDDIHLNFFGKLNVQLRTMAQFRSFRYGTEAELRRFVEDDRRNMPNKVAYSIGMSDRHRGQFKLYYIFRSSVREEFIGIKTEGFKFRKRLFKKPEQLIDQWKRNLFRDCPYPPPNPDEEQREVRENQSRLYTTTERELGREMAQRTQIMASNYQQWNALHHQSNYGSQKERTPRYRTPRTPYNEEESQKKGNRRNNQQFNRENGFRRGQRRGNGASNRGHWRGRRSEAYGRNNEDQRNQESQQFSSFFPNQ